MRPLRRRSVDKGRSAAQFRGHSKTTKRINIVGPMRGGIRL